MKNLGVNFSSLRKMKRLADFKLRKQLSEELVLSKLSYCDTVFDSLPTYQIKRLQKVMALYLADTPQLLMLSS